LENIPWQLSEWKTEIYWGEKKQTRNRYERDIDLFQVHINRSFVGLEAVKSYKR
jgi:hypothetical protein